jgi:hypothetical protein
MTLALTGNSVTILLAWLVVPEMWFLAQFHLSALTRSVARIRGPGIIQAIQRGHGRRANAGW